VNGAFTACSNTSCIYEFSATDAQISGTSAISLPILELNTPVALTNFSDLSVTSDLAGSGDFLNGNGSTLRLKAGVALDELTYNFSTDANDLVFEGNSDVDLPAGTYHNIEVAFVDDRKKLNMDANVTINNNLTLTDGKIEVDAGATVSVGGDLIVGLNSDEFNVKNANFTVLGNVDMDGGTIKTDDASTEFNIGGNVDVSAGVLELKKGTTSIDGNLSMNGGTFSQGGNRGADSADLTVLGEVSFTTSSTIAFVQGNFETDDFTVGSGAQIDLSELVSVNVTGQSIVEGQIIFQDGPNTPNWTFADLRLNSASNLVLTNAISISGILNLIDGNLELGNNNVELLDGATITGGSSASFIELNGTGVIRQFYSAAGATLNFPMGNTSYSPITELTINSASFVGGDYLDISLTESPHPNRSTANTPNGDDDGTTATDFINRFWTISANGISNPSYDISTVYVNSDVVGTEANLVGTLYRIPQGESFLDWLETGTVNAATNTISLSGTDNWGDVYAMDNDLNRLPVELVSFEVLVDQQRVVLRWMTASEDNNDRFVIERSTNGKDWLQLGEVIGVGTTAGTTQYEFVDAFPEAGKDYYRLKQVDFSGEFTYSSIELVEFKPVANRIERLRLVKNPVSVGEPLRFVTNLDSSFGEYQLMKINGVQIAKGPLNELLKGTVLLNHSGLYVLNVVVGGKRQAIKILVL